MTILPPYLIIYRSGIKLRSVAISDTQTRIGRRADNGIVIDHLHVSGQHALITKVDQTLFIQDTKSTNGTFLNGKRISKQPLKHLDIIEIGPFCLELHEIESAEIEPLSS